ncbi:type VI secretion system membrane subunit TssM [Enterovibrio nigricans]|uniref:Type VI secretion protein IcmF n=1 Tax=Enterovibrio nigricans DSM 22720 TaxID=1121868 RepID=A0A1T4VBJ0_9GAMM|nr:type VI secretion system membrane subunit TssM [Enterovibrio nigricans]SKA62273.1 type VI secretion protein IcmF [Enterovibrio nigricans DSM 22720]
MFSKLKILFAAMLPSIRSSLPVLMVLVLILLNVAIWWAGPWLTIRDTQPLSSIWARATASAIVILLWLGIWGINQWRKLSVYQDRAKREVELQEDPIKRFEEQQDIELNRIVKSLKDSLGKKDHLYALPWYLLLGEENAGKTSLINRSGQDFAFSSALRASQETKSKNPFSFDWWVGEDSVLIDPAGELITQRITDADGHGEMEQRLWTHFLNWLNKTRNRRPLNGIVVTVDIAKLASASVSERKAHAAILRTRLNELMSTLSNRPPVYVSLTKLDLLYGFAPFFSGLKQKEREEALGFTFSFKDKDKDNLWLGEFDSNYVAMVQHFERLLPTAFTQSVDAEQRTAIYSFYRQMAGLQDVLAQFLKSTFSADQFSTPPVLRGLYFTSVYQQGVPVNAFVDSAARRYQLSQMINSAQNANNSTTYFTKRLFNDIFYPEAGLALDSNTSQKAYRRSLGFTVFACSIFSVLLIGSWHKYYESNVEHSAIALAKVQEFDRVTKASGYPTTGEGLLAQLNLVREAQALMDESGERKVLLSGFGLHQGNKISVELDKTYQDLVETRYLPALLRVLAFDIADARIDDKTLTALRVFRMLTDGSGRHDNVVKAYFATLWQEKYEGERETQDSLMNHLQYALVKTDLSAKRLAGNTRAKRTLAPYDDLVKTTQQYLLSIPLEHRVYMGLKKEAALVLGSPINLSSAIGPVFDVVFSLKNPNREGVDIPKFLSHDGFEQFFMPKLETLTDMALVDTWVLGLAKSTDFSEQDRRALQEKIRNQYVADYSNSWRKAISNLDVRYFEDIYDAVWVLESVVGNHQPLHRLLALLLNSVGRHGSLKLFGS